MQRVIVEAGAAIGQRPGLKISFNFAAQLFRDDSIVQEVRSIFAGTPIELTQVVLELTERDPIENLTETRRVIAALQGLGLRIAIDDVGHRPQRPVLHAQGRRRHHQDRQDFRRRDRHRSQLHHHR